MGIGNRSKRILGLMYCSGGRGVFSNLGGAEHLASFTNEPNFVPG